MTIDTVKLYQKYKKRFEKMNDEELINSFNREVRNTGWTSSRACYLSALHEEFENRDFDYSTIGKKDSLSFRKKVKLFNKKLVIDE